jgi:iron(III) transport system substrate-binding protein
LPSRRPSGTRRTRTVLALCALVVGALLLGACGSGSGDENTVRVYSGRHYDLEEAFADFTEQTGIKVEFQFGNDAELREKIVAEGEDTPADAYITVDAGNLVEGAEQGIFQPLDSQVLDDAIPPALRDPDNQWFGLATRARSIVYDPAKVDPSELSTYADLADPKWKGKLCLRNSSGGYQQSLVAALIGEKGEDEAKRIVEGWLDNAELLENDVLVLDAIDAGRCEVGITNHYYLARKYDEDPNFPVRMFWADQGPGEQGVHVNISGGGVTKHAERPELARQLLEWMATTGQQSFIAGNHEFPANPSVEPDQLLQERFDADFRHSPLTAQEMGALNAQAVQLMNEVDYR